MYHLPKGYLSHSAMDLWLKNPKAYRAKYYEKSHDLVTPEITFGKNVATLLEHADDSLKHVKQYSHPEYKLDFTVGGVPILGYIDSFDPEERRFLEFKTGHAPWDAVRVRKHPQLTLYSLGIQTVLGSVHDECELVWLETEKVKKQTLGLIRHEDAHSIRLTGRMEVFKREIEQWERDRMAELIVKIAAEISEDYQAYKNRPRRGSLGLR